MTLEEINAQFDIDNSLRQDNLHHEAMNTPNLHAKWSSFLMNETRLLRQLYAEMDTLKLRLELFYSGKLDDKAYMEKEVPFNVVKTKLLKTDIATCIKADSEYQELNEKLQEQILIVDTIGGNLKMISNRAFLIRDAMEYIKFLAGK